MRANFILILIIILLFTLSCNETKDYNGYPEITTPAATTKPQQTAEPVIPENDAVEFLPAIIENLQSGLNVDYEEYKQFAAIINSVNSNDIDTNAAELIAVCETLYNDLSEAGTIWNDLTEAELSAITSLGMNAEGYNALYENYKFLRNMKLEVLTAIIQHLEDVNNLRENLDTIIEFYQGYTTFFQVSMYYTVNSILNDCTVENDSIADFRDNFYPILIEPFSDTMKWETDNAAIDEIFQQLYADVETLITDFSENSGLISEE